MAGGSGAKSPKTAFLFLFNIVVGTGVLTLPLIFAHAGLILSTLFILVVGLLASGTSKLMLESQAIATGLQQLGDGGDRVLAEFPKRWAGGYVDQTAELFRRLTPRAWTVAWFVVIIVYLLPDLAVYAVFIPSTVAHVFDTASSEVDVYTWTLVVLGICITPLSFFTLQETVVLQILTTISRHSVLLMMIAASIAFFPASTGYISVGNAPLRAADAECALEIVNGSHAAANHSNPLPHPFPPLPPTSPTTPSSNPTLSPIILWDESRLPLLFGGAVYSMISQQYVTSMFSALDRPAARGVINLVYIIVSIYILLLCWTTVLAFEGQPSPPQGCGASTTVPCGLQPLAMFNFAWIQPRGLAKFIFLAPLLSLLSSFPVIAITLRDTMILLMWALGGTWGLQDASGAHAYNPINTETDEEDDEGGWGGGGGGGEEEGGGEVVVLFGDEDEDEDEDEDGVEGGREDVVVGSGGGRREDSNALVLDEDEMTNGVEATPTRALSKRRGSASSGGGGGGIEMVERRRDRGGGTEEEGRRDVVEDVKDLVREISRPSPSLPSPTDAPFVVRMCFGLLAVVPPLIAAFLTRDVDQLVGITGGFGGAFIMFIAPAVLVTYARRLRYRVQNLAATKHPGATELEKALAHLVGEAPVLDEDMAVDEVDAGSGEMGRRTAVIGSSYQPFPILAAIFGATVICINLVNLLKPPM